MSYRVEYTKAAREDLEKLDYSIAQRIIKKINFWKRQEHPLHFAKPLQGAKGVYRFRVGDYRILFELTPQGEIIILFILAIRHRRDIYRI